MAKAYDNEAFLKLLDDAKWKVTLRPTSLTEHTPCGDEADEDYHVVCGATFDVVLKSKRKTIKYTVESTFGYWPHRDSIDDYDTIEQALANDTLNSTFDFEDIDVDFDDIERHTADELFITCNNAYSEIIEWCRENFPAYEEEEDEEDEE